MAPGGMRGPMGHGPGRRGPMGGKRIENPGKVFKRLMQYIMKIFMDIKKKVHLSYSIIHLMLKNFIRMHNLHVFY